MQLDSKKNKLHQYIERANDYQLDTIISMVEETGISDSGTVIDEESMKIYRQRVDDIDSGKETLFTLEEAKARFESWTKSKYGV